MGVTIMVWEKEGWIVCMVEYKFMVRLWCRGARLGIQVAFLFL